MAEKTVLKHVEFKKFKDLMNFYWTNETIMSLAEDVWGLIRVQYPKGYYDEYYVFAAVDATPEHIEIPIERTMILVKDCSVTQREHIDDMFVRDQPGEPNMSAEDMVKVDELFEDIDEHEDSSYVFCESLEEVLDHFDSHITDLVEDEWDVYRLNWEDPEHPNSYVFVAINVSLEEPEEIDIIRAILPKEKCSPEDKAAIESIQSIEYSEEEIEKTPSSPVVPTWNGHTVH